MANKVPVVELNSGAKMPRLGFGTFSHENATGATHRAVLAALEAGFRHIDTAWSYHNEKEVGSGLHEFLSKHPEVKRSDIFITTKVWVHLYEPEDVEWSANDSLKNLGEEYVDLLLLHWPFAAERTDNYQVKFTADNKYIIKKELTANLEPTWRAMEKLYSEGKAKSIGVSNFSIKHLEAMAKYAKVPPAVNQVEIHPYLPNDELVSYCLSHNIHPVGYSPLGTAPNPREKRARVTDDKDLIEIANKNGITMAQLLIAWGIKRGYTVIPKSSNEERIRNNIDLVDLSDETFAAVNNVAKGKHIRFVELVDFFGYNVWKE
ncbi:putative alcohol dehydrogenase [Xylogone sp. PMI_703]|nr:putative alcohol dehydrogenase [Xylogone sp. PMI_703]